MSKARRWSRTQGDGQACRISIAIFLYLIPALPPALAADSHDADEAAIRAGAQEYARAFAAGDSARIMSLWDDSAVFCDQFGNLANGKNEIEKQCSRYFSENSKPAMEITINSIKFPSEDTALESGVSTTGAAGSAVQRVRYLATHVKRNGKWFIAGVSETPYLAGSPAEALKPLRYLLGRWKAEGPNGTLSLSFEQANDNVICRKSEFTGKDGAKKSQTEYIYWNPQSDYISSFEFDSNGGTGKALWQVAADGFCVRALSKQSDGKDAFAEYLLKRIDDDHFAWQSRRRRIGATELPDIDQIKASRQKG